MLKGAKKDLPKLAKFLLSVWIGTIFLFFGGIGYLNTSGGEYFVHPSFFLYILFLGVGAFLLMIIFAILGAASNPEERKMGREKKSNKSPSSKQSKLSYYLASGIVILLLSVTYLYAKSEGLMQKSKVQNYNYLKKTPTPTLTPTPTVKPKVKGSTSDPIITCNIHADCGGGSRQIRKSECDKMNCCLIDQRCGGPKFILKSECTNSYCCLLRDGTGKLLSSKTACDNYYSNNNSGSGVSNIPPYKPKSYYPCTLCYHYSSGDSCNTYNYLYETKAQCDNEQARIDSLGSSYSTPTPQPTFDVDAYNAQVAQCQRDVGYKYGNIEVNCNNQFGASSATEACIQILSADRQEEYDNCGTKL